MPSLLLFGGGAPTPPSGTVTVTAVDGAASVIVEKRGGTVVKLTGTGFDNTMTVDILLAAVVVGTGYIMDPVFDVTATTAYVGMPVLAPGSAYDIRVTVGVDTGTLSSAIIPLLHNEESKVHQARRGFDLVWDTGPRILTNNLLELGVL